MDLCHHRRASLQEPDLEECEKKMQRETEFCALCAQSRPDIKVYKTSFVFLEFLGHSLRTEYIHCAYSKLTLQNDLHLCYLRSSGMVQGG